MRFTLWIWNVSFYYSSLTSLSSSTSCNDCSTDHEFSLVLHAGHFQNLESIYWIQGHLTRWPLNPASEKLLVSPKNASDLKPSPTPPEKMIKYPAFIVSYECTSIFLQRKYLVLKCSSMQKKTSGPVVKSWSDKTNFFAFFKAKI